MADMRRRGEPSVGLPRIEHKPGMAEEMLRELAPLLAKEGIDLSGDDIPDMETLQAALDRTVERRNLELISRSRSHRTPRPSHYRPGSGTKSAQRRTSSPWHARERRSGLWTNS